MTDYDRAHSHAGDLQNAGRMLLALTAEAMRGELDENGRAQIERSVADAAIAFTKFCGYLTYDEGVSAVVHTRGNSLAQDVLIKAFAGHVGEAK